jgi:aspartate/glutamate racemase
MEAAFYPELLGARGVETIVPDPDDRAWIHASIFGELTKGVFTDATRARYIAIIERLVARGAKGVILGCTEIPLLLRERDCRCRGRVRNRCRLSASRSNRRIMIACSSLSAERAFAVR